jgi:hypothetical protein
MACDSIPLVFERPDDDLAGSKRKSPPSRNGDSRKTQKLLGVRNPCKERQFLGAARELVAFS